MTRCGFKGVNERGRTESEKEERIGVLDFHGCSVDMCMRTTGRRLLVHFVDCVSLE